MGCFEESAAIELTDTARRQAALSLTSGGMGLRSLEAHAPAAYISSSVSSAEAPPTRYFSEAIELYNESWFTGVLPKSTVPLRRN